MTIRTSARDAVVQISGLQVSSGKTYERSRLVDGERVYTDRRYIFNDTPPASSTRRISPRSCRAGRQRVSESMYSVVVLPQAQRPRP